MDHIFHTEFSWVYPQNEMKGTIRPSRSNKNPTASVSFMPSHRPCLVPKELRLKLCSTKGPWVPQRVLQARSWVCLLPCTAQVMPLTMPWHRGVRTAMRALFYSVFISWWVGHWRKVCDATDLPWGAGKDLKVYCNEFCKDAMRHRIHCGPLKLRTAWLTLLIKT